MSLWLFDDVRGSSFTVQLTPKEEKYLHFHHAFLAIISYFIRQHSPLFSNWTMLQKFRAGCLDGLGWVGMEWGIGD